MRADFCPRMLHGSSSGAEGRDVAVMSVEVRPGFYKLLHHVLPRESNTTLPKVLTKWGGTRLHVGDDRSLRRGLPRGSRGYATEWQVFSGSA